MNTLNPFFAVTLAVFAVYLLLALIGSRDRGTGMPRRLRARSAWIRFRQHRAGDTKLRTEHSWKS